MSSRLKGVLLVMMTVALTCGFLHHLVSPAVINFERLHIFLFNLCSGGTLLIYFTEEQPALSRRGALFLLLAVTFAFCAFFQWYLPAMIIPLVLAALVDQVRVDHFGSRAPRALFSSQERVSRKFHQAALLCLSLGEVTLVGHRFVGDDVVLAFASGGRVVRVTAEGVLRKRLLEQGFVPGTLLVHRGFSPLGDPLDVEVRGGRLALRRSEAATVWVESEEAEG